MHKQVCVPFMTWRALNTSKTTSIFFSCCGCVKCFGSHVDPYDFFFSGDDPEYLITGTHAYPSGPGKYASTLANDL